MDSPENSAGTLILCSSLRIRRLWLKAIQGTSNIPKEKFFADAIPYIPLRENVFLVGPVVGAPSAGLVVNEFLSRGVRRVCLLGVVGSLPTQGAPRNIGDLVFPRKSFPEDGVSAIYAAEISGSDFFIEDDEEDDSIPSEEQVAFENFLRESAKSEGQGRHLTEAGIWTTDCPQLETGEKATRYALAGAGIVDMEYSAVSLLSKLNRAELYSVFVVSDLVGGDAPKKGYASPEVEASLKFVVEQAAVFLGLLPV